MSALAVIGIVVVASSGGDDNKTAGSTLTSDGGAEQSVVANSSAASSETTVQPLGTEPPAATEPVVAGSTAGSPSTTAAATSGAGTTVAIVATTVPAAPGIALGQADAFAVLGSTAVESSGATVIAGQVGASNGPIRGLSAIDNPAGMIIVSPQSALVAQQSIDVAVADIDGGTSTPVAALSGKTIGPGAHAAAAFEISGTLTLDGGGDPNAVFVFIATDTLNIAGSSQVVLTGGAQACNVFWRIGSSATLGTGSTFVGTVIADVSITAAANSDVDGRLIARNGSVTVDTASIVVPTCA
ncbi:MAG: ice-binding family protein [Ilumatobacteraceae bacterium]